jgi:hypothetical protein
MAELARRQVLPTGLSSRELAGIEAEIREYALFSARTESVAHLLRIYDEVVKLADGRTDVASARLRVKESARQIGYWPEPGKEGTIEDLGSRRRIDLILNWQRERAQAYGTFVQGNNEAVLDLYPCQELVRIRVSVQERNWYAIWQENGGMIYAGNPPGGALVRGMEGRCIASKDDPIWSEISEFGSALPPFRYGSGVGLGDVRRDVAEGLGVIDKGERVAPQDLSLMDGVQATLPVADAGMRKAILESLGPGYEFDGDILKAA